MFRLRLEMPGGTEVTISSGSPEVLVELLSRLLPRGELTPVQVYRDGDVVRLRCGSRRFSMSVDAASRLLERSLKGDRESFIKEAVAVGYSKRTAKELYYLFRRAAGEVFGAVGGAIQGAGGER